MLTILDTDYCTTCHTRLRAAHSMTKDCAPIPGDVTVCINCGIIMQFGPDLELLPVSIATLKANENKAAALKLISKHYSDKFLAENGHRLSTMHEQL